EQSFVTVSTDKLSYTSGEAVHIGGRASPVITGQSVLIRVLNPNNVLYKQDFAIVNPEGAYTYDLVIGGPLGISGSYTIKAFYNGQVASKSIGFTNTRTPTSLELSPIQSVPWGQKVKVTGILKNTQTGLGLGSKTITFDGSGAFNLSPVTTKPDGTFTVTGASPDIAGGGWNVQAHFAGDPVYDLIDSSVVKYSTTKHNTSITLKITPTKVVHGGMYSVTGVLKDMVTNTALASETVTFTASSPIVISPISTDTTGTYSVTGLAAPGTAGKYSITAKFAGDSLYNPKPSSTQVLTVT